VRGVREVPEVIGELAEASWPVEARQEQDFVVPE
jgi:hypothetical protein